MKYIKRPLCIILSLLFVFTAIFFSSVHAVQTPLDVEVTHDKSSYSLKETVKLFVKVTNRSEEEYKDVSLIVSSNDYGLPKGGSYNETVGTLRAGDCATADFSLILSKKFSDLTFFQKITLFFRYIFKKFITIPAVNLNGRNFIKETVTLTQAGKTTKAEVYVCYGGTGVTPKPTDPVIDPHSGTGSDFSLTMLNVGQGLSLLIQSNGKYMIYDGGGRDTSSYVVAYLKAHDISLIDYLVASHYDEDHIAGLIGVLNTTQVSVAYTPAYTADTSIYNSFCSKLSTNGAINKHPAVGETFSLGETEVTFISPINYSYGNENNFSLAVRIVHGAFSCIITGDAETEAELDMISGGYAVDSDLLVVGHHGSSSSSCSAFIKAVAPEYAFISVGAGNPYKHPTAQTLNTLSANNVSIFRTDESGEVTCYSDSKRYWFSTNPSTDWSEGSYILSFDANGGSGAPSTQSGSKTYVIPSKTPSKDGWIFVGWALKSDAVSAQYTEGNKITVNDNTVLYAVWRPAPTEFRLSYNANGGSGAPSTQTGSKTYTISYSRPTRSGYTFLGWSTSSSASYASYSPGDSITINSDTVLYAVWQKIEHRIYRTKTGKKYHYNNHCGSGTYYEITLDEALAAGLTPCEKCVHD